jgi:vacuolar-type H+-ATPase subunit H
MNSLLLLFAAAASAAPSYPAHSCADAAIEEAVNALERRVYLASAGRENALENVRMTEGIAKEFRDESIADMERQLSALPNEVLSQLGGFFRRTLAMRDGEDVSAVVLARHPAPVGGGLEALLATHEARKRTFLQASREAAERRAPEIRERQLREAREFKASLQLPFYLKPARSALEGVIDRFVQQTGAGVPELEASVVSARAYAALSELALREVAILRDESLRSCGVPTS